MEELLKLFVQAKSNNKNVSGLLGNLDSPMLALLAGQIDPMAIQAQSSGGLYGQYASDPNTPDAVKAIMDFVDQGANKYQIQSSLNSLDPSVVTASGYTPEQLDAMAADMVKERGDGDMWSKAGLRNPLDVYTTTDVPINAAVALMMNKDSKNASKLAKAMSDATMGAYQTRRRSDTQKADIGRIADIVSNRKTMTSGMASGGMARLADWLKGQNTLSEDRLSSAIEQFKPKQRGERASYENAIKSVYGALEDKGVKYKKTMSEADELSKQQRKLGIMKNIENSMVSRNNAYRRGVLQAYNEMGKTPTQDQLAGMMKFIAAK